MTVYTSNLFIKLHDLIVMYMTSTQKRSVIDILTEFMIRKELRKKYLLKCV